MVSRLCITNLPFFTKEFLRITIKVNEWNIDYLWNGSGSFTFFRTVGCKAHYRTNYPNTDDVH